MRNRIGTDFARNLDQALGNQRPCDRGTEQVQPFVQRIGAHHREDEIADEFLAQIVDIDVLGLHPHHLGLGARGLQLLALPQIGGEGDDLAVIILLEPFQDDAGVEPARIGEDDLVDLIGHGGDSNGSGIWGALYAGAGSGAMARQRFSISLEANGGFFSVSPSVRFERSRETCPTHTDCGMTLMETPHGRQQDPTWHRIGRCLYRRRPAA
ncbi:hypothetical protein SPHINGOAX6_40046 [Sphingomonas sp. AX6]|nr:hypothetical protein SPHINGOAX6_40046 [Sphingomonas sp. AX6]